MNTLGIEALHVYNRLFRVKYTKMCSPLARREAPAEGRRPEGEGANLNRRLVPYHVKCRQIQSGIVFIYLYICINRGPHARHQNIWAW